MKTMLNASTQLLRTHKMPWSVRPKIYALSNGTKISSKHISFCTVIGFRFAFQNCCNSATFFFKTGSFYWFITAANPVWYLLYLAAFAEGFVSQTTTKYKNKKSQNPIILQFFGPRRTKVRTKPRDNVIKVFLENQLLYFNNHCCREIYFTIKLICNLM